MNSRQLALLLVAAATFINFIGLPLLATNHFSYAPLGVAVIFVVNLLTALFCIDTIGKQKPNPWDHQRVLMAMSAQDMPATPKLTNATILYTALLMEELGETIRGVCDALTSARHGDLNTHDADFDNLIHHLMATGQRLEDDSTVVKKIIPRLRLDFVMPPAIALELFDGTTDIAVVNCGFALATGLPGAEGYEEVARSNHSKANPRTGVIDKTADGKWIKGADFFLPDLLSILERHSHT